MAHVNILLNKEEARKFGAELQKIRHEKHMYLKNVAAIIKVPERIIEGMELGRFMRYGALQRLLKFYGKKVKIGFDEEK